MTDEKKLTDEYLSIEQAEVKLKSSYVPKLSKALPATKVARYLQIQDEPSSSTILPLRYRWYSDNCVLVSRHLDE
jgi:hypothetical protein